MNKISSGQMTVLLLLSNAFMLMCVSAPIGMESMLGAVFSFVLQMILCIPMLLLYHKGFSLSAYCKQKHYRIPAMLVFYLISRGGISFLLLWNGSENLSLPFSQPLIAAGMIVLVCLYTSALGLRTTARAGTVSFGFLVFTLGILLLGAYQHVDFQQLHLTEENTVWFSTLKILSLADTLPALFILLSFSEKQKAHKALRFLALSLILWELILFLCITVLGPMLSTTEYPFFLLTAVSQPLSTQRADAFYLIVFVMLCVIRLTLLTVLSAHLLGMMFPNLRCRSVIALVGMMLTAAVFSMVHFTGNLFDILTIVFLACILPLIFCIRLKKHPAWKEEEPSS